jgi:multisubunit Na+/H+ antiporter MnhE subunit
VNDILNQAISLFQQGFDTVNSIQGLIIALIAAFLMRRFGQIIAWALAATIIHEVASGVRRYLAGDASPLPNLTDIDGDLKLIGIRFLGYLIAIAILYIVRRIVMNR